MNFAPFAFQNQGDNSPKVTYILNMSGVTNDVNVTLFLFYDQGDGEKTFSYTFSNVTTTGTFSSGPISTPNIKTTNGNPSGDLNGQYSICRNGVARTIDVSRIVTTVDGVTIKDVTNTNDQSITACPTTVSRTSGNGTAGLINDNTPVTITVTLTLK
jgi:hypothetical protein